jgi:hypothetical protein
MDDIAASKPASNEPQIELAGARMDTAFREPAWQFLKDYYGGAEAALEILDHYGKAGADPEDWIPVLVALTIQATPRMSPTDARRAIMERGLLIVGADLLRIGGMAVELPSLGVHVERPGHNQRK